MFYKLFFITLLFIPLSYTAAQQMWCNVNSRALEIQNGAYDIFLSEIKSHLDKSIIRTRSEKWIQVVVHDVSEASTSISYAQVIQQIDVLNNDFAKKGANISKLNAEFVNLAADTDIRFCLATTDPDGNPTTGITFRNTDIDRIALARDLNGRHVVHYDQLGGRTGWDPTRYVNIWVADFGGTGILGSASLPGTAPYSEEIGLVMDRNYFGSIGSALPTTFYNRGHTLTHEMGHFFGLLHIWGDEDNSCTDSDEVDDTPNAAGPYLDCPSGMQSSCGESNMYQNFMDLTDDRCLAAFTHDQALRMQATIELFYPDLISNGPCREVVQPFDQWWKELVWAYDQNSGQYVIYHMDGFSPASDVNIYAADGRRVHSDRLDGQQSLRINLNGVPGIYFVFIRNEDATYVRKISIN